MWKRCRVALRAPTKGRRPMKGIESLSAPKVKRRWGDFRDLQNDEKKEFVSGEWRQAMPVQLLHQSAGESLSFESDERAEAYLQREEKEELAEQPIPTLSLAQQFYNELATTADEEVDVTAAAMPQSDEEREEEILDANRHFFGDYYIQQGICPEHLKFAFIDAMLRPAAALFLLNGSRPLVRLVVRDQLESHAQVSGVIQPTALSPMVFALEMVPTQPLGELPRLPYTAASSVLQLREQEADCLSPEELQLSLIDDGRPEEEPSQESAPAAEPPRVPAIPRTPLLATATGRVWQPHTSGHALLPGLRAFRQTSGVQQTGGGGAPRTRPHAAVEGAAHQHLRRGYLPALPHRPHGPALHRRGPEGKERRGEVPQPGPGGGELPSGAPLARSAVPRAAVRAGDLHGWSTTATAL
ncbi:hypothetical protein AGDE_15566 [Angomonas deanei]|uniref:Uncharacterized protein n=1 Tax=Angomonas deanei TaxID=59799 RepID=A0A7G2C8X4_9TRYP|nr:hypothetical protein AGDE_15566 [Angomonas deanei]CAD2215979.1 hypothetical protein, conserved [Angomonas deanei]|eukprot:EPY18845.1 hypothetical protein AGDE_15566 [Angomonas deanei]